MGNVGQLTINARSMRCTQGAILVGSLRVPCALGRTGRAARKREGDGATPVGVWRIVEVLYRADRVPRPQTVLPVGRLKPNHGWCDAVGDRNYNRLVRHPYPASAERMWRDDALYDVVVVLSHNRVPRVQGAGSAIFMHLNQPNYTPTEGCIALNEHNLRRVLAHVGRQTRLCVAG